MRTLGALLLGIVIGTAGLLAVQHHGSIRLLRTAFGPAPLSAPVIRQDHPHCSADSQRPCK
jgi:hypothetical protein